MSFALQTYFFYPIIEFQQINIAIYYITTEKNNLNKQIMLANNSNLKQSTYVCHKLFKQNT